MKFFSVSVLLGLALAAGLGPSPAEAQDPGQKPAVLLITLDTTRADKLGSYGSKEGLTPSLDALAQRCYIFDHCESSVPMTMPSHATIMSGWYPYRHGIRKNLEAKIPPGVPLLAEAFKKDGYETGAFVSAWILLARYGFARGFDEYEDSFSQHTVAKEAQRRCTETLKLADDWLKGQKKPWFCWVHLFDPHEPYDPPEPYATQFKTHPYDGEIAFMDDALGSFFGLLLQRGQLQNTIVVICGDHGESLGEHGEATHGVFIYESTTHVPLLVHLPGQTESRHISDTVGLVDIAPTLRRMCGLTAVPEDGVSLAPLMMNQAFKAAPVYMESMTPLLDYGWAPLYGRVEENIKYIMAPHDELYDVVKDPSEDSNLVNRERGRADAMKEALKKVVSQRPQVTTQPIKLDSEELNALKSLGYIGGSPGLKGATYADPKDKIEEYKALEESRGLMNQGKHREAAAILEKLYQAGNRSPHVLYGLCMAYFQSDPERSLKYALETIKRRPDFPEPYERAALTEMARGRYQNAKDLIDIGIKETGDWDGSLSLQGGWAAYYLNRPDSEVIGYLHKGDVSLENHYMGAKLRCMLSLRRGDKTDALKWVSVMSRLAPPDAIADLSKEEKFKPLLDMSAFQKIIKAAQKKMNKAGPSGR